MRHNSVACAIFTISALLNLTAQAAPCAVPYALTNGQPTDATQVMANYNALLACINSAPGGSTNAVQFNSGSGFGGVGPLTDGQVVIGSTGNPPQAATLSAGSGIAISTGPGSITLSATGSGGTGLYGQVMSITPTSSNTGLATWLNQSGAVATDSAVGLNLNVPSSSSDNLVGRYLTAPTPPYTITALVATTRHSNSYNDIGIGWYDGSSKLHVVGYALNSGTAPLVHVTRWNSVTSFNNNDLWSEQNSFSQPIWFQISDDGTNVSFSFSQDGANFLVLYAAAKSSTFLGSSGYSNIVFWVNPLASQTLGTLMSWTKN